MGSPCFGNSPGEILKQFMVSLSLAIAGKSHMPTMGLGKHGQRAKGGSSCSGSCLLLIVPPKPEGSAFPGNLMQASPFQSRVRTWVPLPAVFSHWVILTLPDPSSLSSSGGPRCVLSKLIVLKCSCFRRWEQGFHDHTQF